MGWLLFLVFVEETCLLRKPTLGRRLVISDLQNFIGGVQIGADHALLLVQLHLQNVVARQPVFAGSELCRKSVSFMLA